MMYQRSFYVYFLCLIFKCLYHDSGQELGKTWEEVQSEDDRELVDDEDE